MNKVHRSIVVCALLTALGGSAFGWGNLTHVSLSRQLGVPIGALNMNEMYGAVLPDMANFDFSDEGQAMAQALHFNTDLMMGLYTGAPTRKRNPCSTGYSRTTTCTVPTTRRTTTDGLSATRGG